MKNITQYDDEIIIIIIIMLVVLAIISGESVQDLLCYEHKDIFRFIQLSLELVSISFPSP